MKEVKTSWWFEDDYDGEQILKLLERAGRTCYKSEDKITPDSSRRFVDMITHVKKHESVLEHQSITVHVICDRGISHEIVRHRIGAYSQESTRYCNYCSEKFNEEITVVRPEHLNKKGDYDEQVWRDAMLNAERSYFKLISMGWTPQEARGVLPTELKTEIVITYNLRQWRHFFQMRCSTAAHPQVRVLALSMLKRFKEIIPVVFDDLVFSE